MKWDISQYFKYHGHSEEVSRKCILTHVAVFTADNFGEMARHASRSVDVEMWLDDKLVFVQKKVVTREKSEGGPFYIT